MALAGEVEIEKLILDELQIELLDQLFVVEGQVNLATFLLAQQIHTKHSAVKLLHLVEVLAECCLCLLVAVVKLYLCINPSLLPKHRHRTSNLQVGKAVVIDKNDLFSFTKIGYMAFVICPSVIVPSPPFLP